jgi:hypothetical protein
MGSIISQFFSGTDGEKSSKRLFCFILVILFCVYFFTNLYTGRVLKDSLEEYLFYLIVIFFFGVAAERWAPKKSVQITEGDKTMTATNVDQGTTVTKNAVTQ